MAKRYYGPYKILRKIEKVAYELELPANAKIHHVFHISLMKACSGNPTRQCSPLPPLLIGNHPRIQPLCILGARTISTASGPLQQILVQWETLSEAKATWENAFAFHNSLPGFDLEGKNVFEEGGNDTP